MGIFLHRSHTQEFQKVYGDNSNTGPVLSQNRHILRTKSSSCCGHAHTFQLVILFPFHSSVLKPDFNLSLRQAKGMGYFNPPSACQVSIKMKFLFQLQCLVACVSCSSPFSLRSPYVICKFSKKKTENQLNQKQSSHRFLLFFFTRTV